MSVQDNSTPIDFVGESQDLECWFFDVSSDTNIQTGAIDRATSKIWPALMLGIKQLQSDASSPSFVIFAGKYAVDVVAFAPQYFYVGIPLSIGSLVRAVLDPHLRAVGSFKNKRRVKLPGSIPLLPFFRFSSGQIFQYSLPGDEFFAPAIGDGMLVNQRQWRDAYENGGVEQFAE